MSKQASSQIPILRNYPDVLGWYSAERQTIDSLQVAVAVRPSPVPAGKPVEVIVLLQNMLGGETDALLRLVPPEKDLDGKAGRFSTPVQKVVRVGLRSGEVGYATLPMLVGHQAQSGEYSVQVEVACEPKKHGAERVRSLEHPAKFDIHDVALERRPIFEAIHGLAFAAQSGVKTRTGQLIGAPFTVQPPTIAALPSEMRPNYVSLWTEADYRDPRYLSAKAGDLVQKMLPLFRRTRVFFPLLKTIQARFDAAGYRLWAGEAVMIAKMLTYTLELGAPIHMAGQESPVFPRWYATLSQTLLDDPDLAVPQAVETLTTRILLPDLIFDSGMVAFSTLSTLTHESFGSDEELQAHLDRLVSALIALNAPLDLTYAWLPLTLGGLVANSSVIMPREDVIETVHLFLNARDKRLDEASEAQNILFEIADDLIERALTGEG
ncbi:MAG: hypothetical protein CUN51_01890 [Candidatus Thermofonsia Clade 1 bacterium]|uniref:Uncharacterized protein n=1 Tax=Candidatus Thermofonsia Clade 1 bacterium TaxID=2364210 RepID=A0A2M8P2C9_9CHLR|nr:MAG: hypothetical protein CUN51_01890 [Candidatus Thermofonsia Clade 1 bacterium]